MARQLGERGRHRDRHQAALASIGSGLRLRLPQSAGRGLKPLGRRPNQGVMPEHRDGQAMRRSEGQAQAGSAVPIEAFFEDAQKLSPEAFEARHGKGFLMVTAAGLDGPKGSSGTELLLHGVDDDPAALTADLAVVVYPLRQREGPSGHLVTIGRETRHDVVIPGPSVSRFHAFAKLNPDGSFLLQDMGSTNGTTVNAVSVPARGAGSPRTLKPGDTVKFGQVEFTFTDARALQEYAVQAAT
jgi:hypothetical protein